MPQNQSSERHWDANFPIPQPLIHYLGSNFQLQLNLLPQIQEAFPQSIQMIIYHATFVEGIDMLGLSSTSWYGHCLLVRWDHYFAMGVDHHLTVGEYHHLLVVSFGIHIHTRFMVIFVNVLQEIFPMVDFLARSIHWYV